MSAAAPRWGCRPYPVAAADEIGRELGLPPAVAQILARRGYATPQAVRRFLAADDRHDPGLLGDMEAATELILRHVGAGRRIVVHGDYDVDGVASTAIVVEALREAGADPSWLIPARAEGYGLSRENIERQAALGTALLVAVDCGITSGPEVEHARGLGIDVVVADHHRPGEVLPDCPVLHPGLGGYPFDGLCAAAVAHKLSAALRARAGLDPAGAESELDLVGLATVCDMVPLRGENRRLAREGLRALGRTRRPGLRALMRIAGLEPGGVDERAVGFRLGPRLNAAGRLRRADAALELLLTRDETRAAEVADELDLLNRERRDVETRILFAAETARAEQDGAPAYVLAGEGWHAGVVGIVASRIADRHHRPCVIIAIDSEGGRGSGRSIPAFDLHAALGECAGHLRRFGGHRAAAGLEIDPERIDGFRRDLVRCAAARLSPDDLVPVEEVDAVVPGTALGLNLAEGVRALGPFGHENPEPTLLVPAARATDLRPMGDEGQHSRFTLASAGARAQGVAFRTTPAQLARDATDPCDAAVRLELREWNGAVEARLVLSSACQARTGSVHSVGAEDDFWTAIERELSAPLDDPPAPAPPGGAGRLVRDRRGEGIAGVAGELLSSGEAVLVVCAQVARRKATLEGLVAGLSRCAGRDSLPLTSWSELARDPDVAAGFPQLLALDPPPAPQPIEEMAAAAGGCDGPSFIHLAWGAPEVEFALAVAREELGLRESLADVYRGLRAAGGAEGAGLRALLEGQGRHLRLPTVCGRLVRVLGELGLASYFPDGPGEPSWCMLEAPRTALERSAAYRAYAARLATAERYLAGEAARFRPPTSAARPA